MRRFERDLKKDVMKQAESSIMKNTHEIVCPGCGYKFNARIGSNTCPHCHKTIDLELDI